MNNNNPIETVRTEALACRLADLQGYGVEEFDANGEIPEFTWQSAVDALAAHDIDLDDEDVRKIFLDTYYQG